MLALLITDENISSSQPQRGQTAQGNTNTNMRSPDQIEQTRLAFLRDPAALERVRQQQPELVDAVNDPQRFRELFQGLQRAEAERERERQNQQRLLNEDPFNVDAQRKIEEIIRQDRVMENLQHAYEHNPEGKQLPLGRHMCRTNAV